MVTTGVARPPVLRRITEPGGGAPPAIHGGIV